MFLSVGSPPLSQFAGMTLKLNMVSFETPCTPGYYDTYNENHFYIITLVFAKYNDRNVNPYPSPDSTKQD